MALTSLQKALIGAGAGVGAGVLLYYLSQRVGAARPKRCREGGEKTKICPERKCREGDVKVTECPDGTTVVTYRCINGEWIPTGRTCRGIRPIWEE